MKWYSKSTPQQVSDPRWAVQLNRCGAYSNRPRLAPKRLTKTWGLSLVFVSDKRPKFTAKARSSPSLRTRQEASGAYKSIVNKKKPGTVPGFCSAPREPTSASGWAI